MTKIQSNAVYNVLVIWYSNFGIVSDFDIRISDLLAVSKNK